MLFCPVDVHAALTHRLKGTFHPDRADVDVSEHGSDEQHRDNRMDDLGDLHPLDSRRIEGEQEEITGRRGSAAADHDDPINHFLAGVEPIGGRMIVSDNTATTLDPFNIDAVGNIAADPHKENQHNTDCEGKAEIVVRVLGHFRPGRECLRTDKRQKQRLAEGNIEP